jgi:hypothetical protein
MKIILLATAAAALAPADAAPKPKKRVAPFEAPFSAAMLADDPEQVLATEGSLELVARCIPDQVPPAVALQILVRSAVDGWAITSSVASPNASTLDLPAGEVLWGQMTSGGPELSSGPQPLVAMAPDGSLLAVAVGARLAAVNVFGVDCLFAGVATGFEVPIAP